MKKRKLWILGGVLLVGCFALSAAMVFKPFEGGPRYKRLPVSFWREEVRSFASRSAPTLLSRIEIYAGLRDRTDGPMVLRDIAAVPVLLELLNDDNEVVRSSAHNALERLDTDALVNALVRRLKNEDTENRCYAIRSLRDLRQDARPAAELLANAALNDADAEVRYWAIEAVTCIVGTEAKQTLLAALKDSNSSVRIEAAICLAMIEEALEQALPVLIEALQDKRREDRGDIAFRLAHFGSKAKASIPALCDALRDADETTRYMAAEALKQIDPEAARRAGIK